MRLRRPPRGAKGEGGYPPVYTPAADAVSADQLLRAAALDAGGCLVASAGAVDGLVRGKTRDRRRCCCRGQGGRLGRALLRDRRSSRG